MRNLWRPHPAQEGASGHIAGDTERTIFIVVGVLLLTGGAILAFSGVLAIVGLPMMAAGLFALARGLA